MAETVFFEKLSDLAAHLAAREPIPLGRFYSEALLAAVLTEGVDDGEEAAVDGESQEG